MDSKDIKRIIDSLEEQKFKLRDELKTVDTAIDSLQKLCKHSMVYDGHDSHKEWHKCEYCGKTEGI